MSQLRDIITEVLKSLEQVADGLEFVPAVDVAQNKPVLEKAVRLGMLRQLSNQV
jgi:hypothetical protein